MGLGRCLWVCVCVCGGGVPSSVYKCKIWGEGGEGANCVCMCASLLACLLHLLHTHTDIHQSSTICKAQIYFCEIFLKM